MAISYIPGVGPANSDIAATIATTPAVSAQITANVPTASAIASAVAAPSLAQITSAITTNAASAGVTLAAIGTQVANNSSSPLNWTLLATGSLQSVNAATVSFSSYRALRIITRCQAGASSQQLCLRLNSDSTGAYSYSRWPSNGTTQSNSTTGVSSLQIAGNANSSSPVNAVIDIFNANTTAIKIITAQVGLLDSSTGSGVGFPGVGSYTGGSAITSITLFDNNGVNWAASANNANAFQVFGAN